MSPNRASVSDICHIHLPHNIDEVKETNANASLIAASPNLYEYALKKAQDGDMEAKNMLDELGIGD
ncbi:MAG: hypothetical protein WC455_16770 [Dehalococcoidia bacterium]